MAGERGVPSVENGHGSFARCLCNGPLDARPALWANDRAHAGGFLQPVPDLDGAGEIGNGVAKCLLRFADSDGDRHGQAALAGAAEGTVADDAGGGFEIGVGQDDDMVLRSTLALDAFAGLGAAGVDIPGDRRRADEADGPHLGMVEQRVDGRLGSVHEVDHAGRQAELIEQGENLR